MRADSLGRCAEMKPGPQQGGKGQHWERICPGPIPFLTLDGQKRVVIRRLRSGETELLKDFLYEAIFIPEGQRPPDREIVERPELRLYYEGFGTGPADHCLVAEMENRVVGAVWTRIMEDYGHVDGETPSLALSLLPECRGQGIGSRLLQEMLSLLKGQGYRQASLAVQKANYAAKMYRKAGFETIRETDEEYIMVKKLEDMEEHQ